MVIGSKSRLATLVVLLKTQIAAGFMGSNQVGNLTGTFKHHSIRNVNWYTFVVSNSINYCRLIIAEKDNDSTQKEIINYLKSSDISSLLFQFEDDVPNRNIGTFICKVFRKETIYIDF